MSWFIDHRLVLADIYYAASFLALVLSLAFQLWSIQIVKRAREYLQKKKEMKRTSYIVSTPNVFAAPASVGPAYPSSPAPPPTTNAIAYPESAEVAQLNLYPATSIAE